MPTPPPPTSAHVSLKASQVADSRGRPTVAVTARLGAVEAVGDCPAGASKGSDEACTVPVAEALAHVETALLPLVRGAACALTDPAALRSLDAALAAGAGPNFATWGANATLPVSRALWRLGAKLAKRPLWQHLRAARQVAPPAGDPSGRAYFLCNIYNGGLHALKPQAGEVLGRERIDVQEIMVVPVAAASYAEALQQTEAIDAALKAALIGRYGEARLHRADEAGFSVHGLGDSDQAIAHVMDAVVAADLTPGRDVKLALDVAASSFYDAAAGHYRIGDTVRDSAAMVAWMVSLVERYPGQVLSIEDGLDENDWQGWRQLTAALRPHGVHTIGDDLFVTQLPRLRRGIAEQSASAVLIKVNQNGTVGGTLDVVEAAHAAGLHCVVSHRSGETLDDSISDLTVGSGAFGLKSGDPQPVGDFPDPASWVRRRKYLRMVAIEAEANAAAGEASRLA